MRIAINANLVSFSGTYRQAGVSKYTEQLVNTLAKIDNDNDYVVYFGNGPHPAEFAKGPNFRLRQSRFNTEKPITRIAWEQAVAPVVLLRDNPTVLHCPVSVLPLLGFCPTVVTIHDLGFMRYPERYRAAKRNYLHVMTSLSAKRAKRIITASEIIRGEIVNLLGISPDKVVVIPDAVAEHFQPLPPDKVRAWRQQNNVPERFVLYVGTLEPRKNVPLLLRAFAAWRATQQADANEVQLILGGAKGWMYDEIFRLVDSLGLQSVTRFQGYISEDDLPLWYNSAECFVYPSIYEGFGLPPLEAMACGCPVITSNTSSLPEVVGDAGLMVGPDDQEGLVAALDRILTNPTEQAHFRASSKLQAAKFNWETVARATLAVYKSVAEKV